MHKVTHGRYSIYFDFFEFLNSKNVRNKKFIALASLELEIGKVTWKVTWLSRTRFRVEDTVFILIFLYSSTQKMLETKNSLL